MYIKGKCKILKSSYINIGILIYIYYDLWIEIWQVDQDTMQDGEPDLS